MSAPGRPAEPTAATDLAAARDVDPITFEVVRGKLATITDEQAVTLKSVSGSPVVTEATDFNNGLYLADGSIATMGRQVLFHTGTMSSVIRGVIERFCEGQGIHDGDMFIVNDPYRGAVHQPDVSIVAPVFFQGRHVAWAGSCAHQLDVGGMSFGSWAVGATEVQQEAMLLPGVKLVRDGEICEDIWQMIMVMTRLPHVLALDLKAMIAANNVAAKRLRELMERYGADVVQRIVRQDIATSELQLRARLAHLPDGVYRAIDYLEHDGHSNELYQVAVAIEKRGEELIFDLAGSSTQAPGFINCTRAGLIGAIFTAMLPILAPDIRWNEGILAPVTIEVPDGVICNATWPAPVSAGTVSAVWVVTNVATAALSRLAACGEQTRAEGPGVTKGSMWVLTLNGRDRDGEPFGTFLLDSTIGGAGAYSHHDGLDASGEYPVPRPSVANVESNESSGPYLYLYRRLVCDTGGPGRMRGGVAAGVAVTPHDADVLHAMLIGHGVEVPNSVGVFGGLEAACNEGVRWRGEETGELPLATVVDAESLLALEGAEVLGAKPGHFDLRRGDILAYSFQGGGGYGDPLERVPAAVLIDVRDGLVSVGSARDHYGVVIVSEPGGALAIDLQETVERRAQIRGERLCGQVPRRVLPVVAGEGGEGLIGGVLACLQGRLRCRCGQDLGPREGNFKDLTRSRVVAAHAHGRRIRLHPKLELREHVCPACATLLESEVARIGAPSLHTLQLRQDPQLDG